MAGMYILVQANGGRREWLATIPYIGGVQRLIPAEATAFSHLITSLSHLSLPPQVWDLDLADGRESQDQFVPRSPRDELPTPSKPLVADDTGLEVSVDGREGIAHDLHGQVSSQTHATAAAKGPEPFLLLVGLLLAQVQPALGHPDLRVREDALVPVQAPRERADPHARRDVVVRSQSGGGLRRSKTGVRGRGGAAKADGFFEDGVEVWHVLER